MSLLPLLVGLLLAAMLLTSLVSLLRHHQHPWRILERALGSASLLAIIGVIGIVPASLWWVPWLLTLLLAAGVVVACRRLLTQAPPAQPSRRQATALSAPSRSNLIMEGLLYLGLLVIALAAG